ncbi:hypothetical protein QYM36_011806 [Artemia franciscana]|uniref:RNA methyltransferase n=1 Tax=Artemia franciscana TaxID=6661 RepID=A0AA88HFI9_ARTSF|nr:hypothetical protein QYM36_011806 [Artemia franciscana]
MFLQYNCLSNLFVIIIAAIHCSYLAINYFSEGIISKRLGPPGKSYAKISKHSSDVLVNKKLEPGTRVTIKLEPIKPQEKFRKGQVVSPLTPLETTGEYWGYQVRLADSLTTAMSQSSFKEGYDLIIGTSERGKDVDDVRFPDFKHALIVFGGVRGLEEAVENDDAVTTSDPSDLFGFYINICPNQGSRTIRTEEAVFIALSVLRDTFF